MEAVYECITLPNLYAMIIDRLDEVCWPELLVIDTKPGTS